MPPVATAVARPDPNRELNLVERFFRFAHLADGQDPRVQEAMLEAVGVLALLLFVAVLVATVALLWVAHTLATPALLAAAA